MLKKTLSLFVAFMLIAAVFGGVTASAQTQSVADLQALINKLMAQVAALSGGTTAPAAATTFTRDLSVGATGSDVAALQLFLNTEVGSTLPGTQYFGALTKAAVIKFQTMNGVPGTGYVGPLTRAAIAAKQAPVVVPGTGTPSTPSTPATTLEGTDGNIASVTNLSQYSAEEVGDGQSDVKVLGMEIEASNDGDIALRSMKISLDPAGNGSGDSDKARDYFETVSIWKGTTKVGSADISDFSESSSNVFSKTITLDSGVVVKADTKEKFYVTVDAASNLDSGDIDSDSWSIDVDNIRFEDGSGVITTDTQSNGQDVSIAFVTFSASSDTELKISVDSTSPKADIVAVSATADTNNVELLKGKMKLDGTSDVVLDAFPVTFTSTGTGVATATANVTLKIGDEEWTETVPVATGLSGTVTFDNLDLTIDAGSTVEFTVLADINELAATSVSTAFDEGDTLLASITASNREMMDVENEEGDQLATGEKTGTATGKAQEFRTSGIALALVGEPTITNSAGTGANDDLGTFTIKFKVTAVGDAIYVPSLVAATTTTTGYNGNTVVIADRAGTATKGGVSVGLTNQTDTTLTDAGNYKIEEGESETFLVTTTIQLPSAGDAGLFRASLSGVAWSLTDVVPVTNLYTSNLDAFKTAQYGLN